MHKTAQSQSERWSLVTIEQLLSVHTSYEDCLQVDVLWYYQYLQHQPASLTQTKLRVMHVDTPTVCWIIRPFWQPPAVFWRRWWPALRCLRNRAVCFPFHPLHGRLKVVNLCPQAHAHLLWDKLESGKKVKDCLVLFTSVDVVLETGLAHQFWSFKAQTC